MQDLQSGPQPLSVSQSWKASGKMIHGNLLTRGRSKLQCEIFNSRSWNACIFHPRWCSFAGIRVLSKILVNGKSSPLNLPLYYFNPCHGLSVIWNCPFPWKTGLGRVRACPHSRVEVDWTKSTSVKLNWKTGLLKEALGMAAWGIGSVTLWTVDVTLEKLFEDLGHVLWLAFAWGSECWRSEFVLGQPLKGLSKSETHPGSLGLTYECVSLLEMP